MLLLRNVIVGIGWTKDMVLDKAAKALQILPDEIRSLTVVRQSLDARKRREPRYVLTLRFETDHEAAVLKQNRSADLSVYEEKKYCFPDPLRRSRSRPVIVGMGPAGLFAALYLARAGIPSLILERGEPVEDRIKTVDAFWNSGTLSPTSNVQFGEGGAGTFSDGKLNTGTHDPRISEVLKTFASFGAPEDILYLNKPHIGTDCLRGVIVRMRRELERLGCEIRFGHCLTGLRTQNGCITGITAESREGSYTIPCDTLVLAPGHSARDTFQMLAASGVPMEQKPFAVGVRIEHLQSRISETQYGPSWEKLPPADYKLACHLPNGRSVFSFCVCPGGSVIAAASEPGGIVTNGMSLYARDGRNINGGLLVNVLPSDFPETSLLSGVAFQRQWEQKAFAACGGSYCAPCQTVGDFLRERPTKSLCGPVIPSYRPGVLPSDLGLCLPDFVIKSLRAAIPLLDRKLHGFASPQALLTGVETRSSSPVRILRKENGQSVLHGLFPCGEGAGYAGGITSAAVDGIRTAEAVACTK